MFTRTEEDWGEFCEVWGELCEARWLPWTNKGFLVVLALFAAAWRLRDNILSPNTRKSLASLEELRGVVPSAHYSTVPIRHSKWKLRVGCRSIQAKSLKQVSSRELRHCCSVPQICQTQVAKKWPRFRLKKNSLSVGRRLPPQTVFQYLIS